MATDFLLIAASVPVPQRPGSVLNPDTATAPLTSETFAQGDAPTAIRPKLVENAVRADLLGRYGGGAYAVAHGFDLTAGAGLVLDIAAGITILDGIVYKAASTQALSNGARTFLWLNAGGTITPTATVTPPAGAQVYLGNALTAGGVITSVDASGVLFARGGGLWRRTADTGVPGDAAALLALSPGLMFVHQTLGGDFLWTGTAYRQLIAPVTAAYTVANGTTDRALNVTGDTLQQVAATLGSLITDLVAAKIIQ